MFLRQQGPGQAGRPPPTGQPYRPERHGQVAIQVARADRRFDTEQALAQDPQPLDHVQVTAGHPDTDSGGVRRARGREVTDQLGQVGTDQLGHDGVIVGTGVLVGRRKRHPPGRTDQRAGLHRHHVTGRHVGQPPPHPLAGVGIDHLHPVGEGALDAVAALGDQPPGRLLAVHEEPGRRTRSGIGGHRHHQVLPAVTVLVTDLTEPDQTAVGGDHRVGGQATGRRQHRGLCVAPAVALADPQTLGPLLVGQRADPRVVSTNRADRLAGLRVLAHHPGVRGGVAGVSVVGADDAGQFGRPAVGGAGHQRGDRRGQRPAALGVVGVRGGHQQRAEVGVTDAQLPVGPGGLTDLLGGEVGEADGDVHRGDDQFHRPDEPLGIEGLVLAQELQQVHRSQIARRVVQ